MQLMQATSRSEPYCQSVTASPVGGGSFLLELATELKDDVPIHLQKKKNAKEFSKASAGLRENVASG